MKISTDKLYSLCNKYQWFMNGDREPYELLSKRNKRGASLKSLASIIWICSSSKWTEQDILKILKQEADL